MKKTDLTSFVLKAVLGLCFLMGGGTAYAQTHAVKYAGTVIDENGEPLPGVSVVIQGTSVGVVTDLDGNFSINAAEGNVLELSCIGFQTRKLTVSDAGNNPRVVLALDNLNLDEVVVVGYGTSTRRDLISSVSTVKTSEIVNIPVTNMAQGLAGRSPGLIVVQSGGGVNVTPSVSIRGGGDPLYVIDGIIRSGDDFRNLSPDDIQSLSILKDASATAIYGSRAANGIIQVTTKVGGSGKPTVEYDANLSFSQPSIWPRQMNTLDRMTYGNLAARNDGATEPFGQEAFDAVRSGSDPEHYPNTDWRALVLNSWAPQHKHNVRLFGGSETNKYYASLGYVDQNSLYKTHTHYMRRANFRLAESATIKAIGLQVNVALDGYRQFQTHPYTSTASGYYQVFSHINNLSPLRNGVNKFGLPYHMGDNPVAETAADAGYSNNTNTVINGRGELIWSLPWVEGLRIRAAANYRYYGNVAKQWRKDAAMYAWDSETAGASSKPMLYTANGTGYGHTEQVFVEYGKTFGGHSVNALAGYEQYYERSVNNWLRRENYDFDIDQVEVGPASSMTNGGSEAELGRKAWIGQLKYNYAGRYYAEGSIRIDGSDYFAPGKRWGTFFSGSAGWVVSAEPWMRPLVEKDILNTLKLRASYGQTGLDSSAGRFAYLTSYNLNNTAYVLNGNFVPGFTEGALPSPDLTWYTTTETDFGFDFASLGSRLYGSFDYFFYKTHGYLVAPTGESYLNQVIGVTMPRVKSDSEYRRAGIEIQLGWKDSIGDFHYDISGNFTWFNSMWARKADEAESSYMNPYTRIQGTLENYYGSLIQHAGYFQSAEDVLNNAIYTNAVNTGRLTAGDLNYVDADGDGRLTNADARRVGKASSPRGQYGLRVAMGYKGFALSMLFQGSTGFDINLNSPGMSMQTGQLTTLPVAFDYQKDFWTKDNRQAAFPRLMSSTSLNGNNNFVGSDFWLVNGSYLRMKDLQFSYDFKYKLLKNAKWLSKLALGISGQNLFTCSNVTKFGLDPENASVENYAYPVERVIAFTLNVGF